nr:hypothetical protein CFP56_60261 [Quercus suber]
MYLFGRKADKSTKRANMSPAVSRRKVAIVGSGCSGMGAAWALKDTQYDVHVFEKSSELGGHTNTQPFRYGGKTTPVDTGFIVMNSETYPNFIRFLREVGIDPTETEMTFGVSRDGGKFEWSGETRGIFAQRRNLFRPKHWRMIFDIIRFNQFALDILDGEGDQDEDHIPSPTAEPKRAEDMSIGEYLDRHGYSQGFKDDYLIPMTAAVWSTSPDKASLDFPAQTLIRFMWNHHLLSTLAARPPWLTITGGSRRYLDAIVESYKTASNKLHIHRSCEVANIVRPSHEDKHKDVAVSWIDATSRRIESDTFSHVILACHGDEVLPLLSKHGFSQAPSPAKNQSSKAKSKTSGSFSKSSSTAAEQPVSAEEQEILSSFQTTENICYLHSDLSLMPTRRPVWTSWNYLIQSQPSKISHPAGVSLTYCMNILQHLPETLWGPVLVTMNPPHAPDPAKTQGTFTYRHPLYTAASVAAQRRLPAIQNARGVSYAGAWTKYGFHEDGFSSGLKAAIDHLGAVLPFDFVDSTYSRGARRPELQMRDHVLRAGLALVLVWLRMLDFALGLPGVATLMLLLGALAGVALDLAEFVGML